MTTELKNMIEELREELHRVAEGRSFCDPEVVAISKKLDRVLDECWEQNLLY